MLFLSTGKIGPGFILAMVLVIAGLGFKLALVPFHMWAPDVYQGSPTPITAFLSVGSKAAGVVAFIRIFGNGLVAFAEDIMRPLDWGMIVAVMAAAAMILGNITALRQTNIKRMLAYSSIAQIGYVMIGMITVSDLGIASVGFYMFVYLFANMGAFAVATLYGDKTGSDAISGYSGLARSSPAIAACMSIFLLSLTGIPPLGGFAAKYLVFAAGIQAGFTWLVIIGLLTAVVSLYYYANVIRAMYFASAEESGISLKPPVAMSIVLVIGVAGLLIFGIYPDPIMKFAIDSAGVLALP
jgi:NADH-quinone oxidoreductase subunit N